MHAPLRRSATLAALALLLAACAGEPPSPRPLGSSSRESLAAARLDTGEALRLINARRAGRGLGPVRLDPMLTALAQRQAQAMAAAGSLSHDVGGSFAARVANLDAGRSAENLGAGYVSTQETITGWTRSPGHDANLLMPEATRVGLALAKNPDTTYGTWWAMVIASDPPRRQAPGEGPLVWFGSNAPSR